MGKAQKLLKIVVTDQAMLEWPEIQKLQAQGHTIEGLWCAGEGNADGYIGPQCWMMDETLRPFLKIAIQAMRDRKYAGKGVTHGLEDQEVQPQSSDPGDASDGSGPGEDKAGAPE